MTKSIWPNEYDQSSWTWPKNDNDKPELVEHDRKLKKESIFSQIQSFLVKFNKLTIIVVTFWSCSNRYGLSVLVIFTPIFGQVN